MANKKRQQLTCICFHANIASMFFYFAPSFCVLYRVFNRQHTDRHYFSCSVFFSFSFCCYCSLFVERIQFFLLHFWWRIEYTDTLNHRSVAFWPTTNTHNVYTRCVVSAIIGVIISKNRTLGIRK